MQHLGFTISRQIKKPTKNQTKQRRHANLPARFAFRQQEKQQNKHRKGPEPQPKKHPHQTTRFALDTEGKPNVSLKYALRNKLASLRPRKQGEKLCKCEKQQQPCEVLSSSCTLRQPPQSPLRRAFSIFQKVCHLREFLQLPKKLGCTFRRRLQESTDKS